MTAATGYVIAGITFRTKKALLEQVRKILYTYLDRGTLIEPDFVFMRALLEYHPDAAQKIGCGITRIWVQTNPVYPNTRNFWLERTDGTSTDFSFMECVSKTSHSQRFYRACRSAIADDIKAFKVRFFTEQPIRHCPLTGDPLSLVDSHVDHVVPFARLVDRFIQERQITVDSVAISGKAEDQTFQDRLVDAQLEQAWQQFHRSQAKLRVVSPAANLSRTKTQKPGEGKDA